MATSQFTIYSSSDVNGPGVITGWSGSLIRVLDYCLYSGSVSKPSAGWLKPIANSASVSGTDVYACYKQPSGSMMTFFVNDYFPNATAAGKEAWITGWESITSLCNAAATANVGGGYGQFPTPAQLLTTGHVVWRKSTTSDNTNGRTWIVLADAYTCYVFIQTGDAVGYYYAGMFGDIFSMKSSADNYKCMIIGRGGENSAVGAASGATPCNGTEGWDGFTWFRTNTTVPPQGIAYPGHFMARTSGGGGSSITVGKLGDLGKCIPYTNNDTNTYPLWTCYGNMQTPNSPDNSYYLSPIWVHEPSSYFIRGRMRGMYQLCHGQVSFTDGQTFGGSGDFAGKTFQVFRYFPTGGMYAFEISNTVEIN